MTAPFSYSSTYVLDKSHYSETYDESMPIIDNKQYIKALVFVLAGIVTWYFSDISGYISVFLMALGVVDALSIRFHKGWWLARQLISKAANNRLTLIIDEQGVKTTSYHINSELLWDDLHAIEKTEKGWLLFRGNERHYLSNRSLSEQAAVFVEQKAASLAMAGQ